MANELRGYFSYLCVQTLSLIQFKSLRSISYIATPTPMRYRLKSETFVQKDSQEYASYLTRQRMAIKDRKIVLNNQISMSRLLKLINCAFSLNLIIFTSSYQPENGVAKSGYGRQLLRLQSVLILTFHIELSILQISNAYYLLYTRTLLVKQSRSSVGKDSAVSRMNGTIVLS